MITKKDVISVIGFTLLGVMCLSIFMTGCGPPPPKKAFTEGGYEQKHANEPLPKGAKVVEDLGNGWIVFKLTVIDEERYFLYYQGGDYSGDSAWAERVITELRAPKPK